MIKVAHVYSCRAKRNSGDFLIGIATKEYFKQNILKKENVSFYDFYCRDKNLYTEKNIETLNSFDYILVGAGGLILPDTEPNKISCWQWVIPKDNYKLIIPPIYLISIGFNLFYGQTMNMPDRNSGVEDKLREPIFKENIIELIKKSVHFTLRHNNDVNLLLNIISEKYRDKVKYEMCPTVWYVNKFWKPKMKNLEKKYIAIEIKDDREWRRYHRIGKEKFYKELEKFVIYCLQKNIAVVYLSHDGSKNFYNYIIANDIKIPILDNSVAKEDIIFDNYSKIHTILCTAGHSQMISYGLGIRIISLVSHPKLRHFCDDVGNSEYIDINTEYNIFEKICNYLNLN